MMNKLFFISLIHLICLTACSQKKTILDNRKQTMIAIIDALSKNDTVKLYNLVDTLSLFSFHYNRKDFTHKIKSTNKILSNNNLNLNKIEFTPADDLVGTSNYKCLIFLNNEKYDSVALAFYFYRGISAFVYDFAVTAHKKQNDDSPLDNAPSGENVPKK